MENIFDTEENINMLFFCYSETEGQAMLKIRDQSDKNALEKLGLVEPEDEAKSMELGFPKQHPGPLGIAYSGNKNEDAIPMVLGDAPHLIDGLMKSNVPGKFCLFIISQCGAGDYLLGFTLQLCCILMLLLLLDI